MLETKHDTDKKQPYIELPSEHKQTPPPVTVSSNHVILQQLEEKAPIYSQKAFQAVRNMGDKCWQNQGNLCEQSFCSSSEDNQFSDDCCEELCGTCSASCACLICCPVNTLGKLCSYPLAELAKCCGLMADKTIGKCAASEQAAPVRQDMNP